MSPWAGIRSTCAGGVVGVQGRVRVRVGGGVSDGGGCDEPGPLRVRVGGEPGSGVWVGPS